MEGDSSAAASGCAPTWKSRPSGEKTVMWRSYPALPRPPLIAVSASPPSSNSSSPRPLCLSGYHPSSVSACPRSQVGTCCRGGGYARRVVLLCEAGSNTRIGFAR